MNPVKRVSILFAVSTLVMIMAMLALPPAASQAASQSPIQHVVIVFQENHSFDNVLGRFCRNVRLGLIQRTDGCRGGTRGVLPNGSTLKLGRATDVVPGVGHSVRGQQTALASGKMNGFAKIVGCTRKQAYACYTQYAPSQVPNVRRLAKNFAVSDATFELRGTPSWGGHMVLGSATLDGFGGNNPSVYRTTSGWGCNSGRTQSWSGVWNGSSYADTAVPSCVPDSHGDLGPVWSSYTGPSASYVPTIFDRLEAGGFSWTLYAGDGASGSDGYGWSICPTFFECLAEESANGNQNFVPSTTVTTAATNGTLPNLSIVTPLDANSQHNHDSMAKGDNWIGRVVSAIMNGPDWSSTAIFITWDDCGCFYDHMNPLQYNPEWGVRVPMIIVSPYARASYTDQTPATFASLLAFTEHTFGLSPLNPCATQLPDPNCTDDVVGLNGQAMYDFSNAFDWTQKPLGPVGMTTQKIADSERTYLRSLSHPVGNGT